MIIRKHVTLLVSNREPFQDKMALTLKLAMFKIQGTRYIRDPLQKKLEKFTFQS